jgi:hypothetical protein
MTFLYFVMITYALCYLAADARIFGIDTTAWNEVYNDYEPASEDDEKWLYSIGIIPFRQQLLLNCRFSREHLSCYFCMGVWAGPLAHTLLYNLYQKQPEPAVYALNHPNTTGGWAIGLLCAFLLGSCGSYVLNAVVHKLEQ